jgi:predicted Zn-dependent peptidase
MEIEEKDVPVIQIADLQKHFQDFVHSARVFVSGKIETFSRDLILEKFEKMLPGNHAHNIHPVIKAHPGRQYTEKKDSVQSSLRIGRRSVVRSHADYIYNLFVSHILGGYFGSRLMKNIREEKGLTYGISASIHALRYDSYLVIGADVDKGNVNLTFDEIRKELKNLRTTKITDDELETSRSHFIGSLQSEITTPFAHAEKIKNISLFNLQRDHYQNMINKIGKITPGNIADISEQYFHEDAFCEVAVG